MRFVQMDHIVSHMDNINHQIGAAVEAAIRKADKNIHRVSVETGIPRTTLNNRLKGARPFDVDELLLVARCLGVNADVFLAPFRIQDAA